jgi:two-component sensor histidine kinase
VHRSDPSRIHASGPKIDLGGKAALGITLALHELCTNASKYGALSNESGSIAIDWSITGGAADARFRMRWKESGGPPVSPPSQSGFGSRLIAHSVGLDLKGETKLSFEPDGVAWELRAPLHSVTGKLGGAS